MRSRDRKKKKSGKKEPSRFVLEKLDSRLLLNAGSEWIQPVSLDDIIGPNYNIPDDLYAASSEWTNAQNEIFGRLDTVEDGYSLPCVVGANNNSDFDEDHAGNGSGFRCTDPLDIGLISPAAAENSILDDNPLTNSEISTDAGGDAYAPSMAGGKPTILYLEFYGDQVSSRAGDFWLGSSSVTIPAYDLSSFGWGGYEEESIEYITQFVEQDYAAYNILVTTDKPASGQYTTMYIGGTNDWFRAGSGIIGVATYDIGNRDDSNYGFAFTEELGLYQNYSQDSLLHFSEYIANLVTHEAGHTFGLNHVSDTTAIMNPYLPVTPHRLMFGSGNIPSSTSTQDSQSLLGGNLGYLHGADDYGDNFFNAQTIKGNSVVNGILERRDDIDTFTYTAMSSGTVSIDIDTPAFGNLDSELTVYRNQGYTEIGRNDDTEGSFDSLLNLSMTAGEEYTIFVSSAANNSSGTYSLTITAADTPKLHIREYDSFADDLTVDFGTVIIDTTAFETFSVTNEGREDLVISQLSANSGFELSHISMPGVSNDDIIIAPGGQQDIDVTFNPDQAGTHNGYITIVSNDPTQEIINLQVLSTVVYPQPNIAISKLEKNLIGSGLHYDRIYRNEIGSETVTITNDGTADLIISEMTVTEPFTLVTGWDNNPVTLVPGAELELTVEVTGESRGTLAGQIIIVSNDSDQTKTIVPLSAQIAGGVLSISESCQVPDDNQIDFGSIYVGENGLRPIILTNTGDGPLIIHDLSIGEGFTFDIDISDEPLVLAADESVTIQVGYSPDEQEEISGELTITTDNNEAPVSNVYLYALGKTDALEITEVDQSNDGLINVGRVRTGQSHSIGIWEITNHGNIPLTINLDSAASSNFAIAGPDIVTIDAGQSHTVNLEFNADPARLLSDTVTVTANDYYSTSKTLTVTADAYALIEKGKPYRFVDQDGDRVTVSVTGTARAELKLGESNQPDIDSITFLDGSNSGSLKIKVSNKGITEIGSISGSANLKNIKAASVDLTGEGINLQGNLSQLNIGNLTNGADITFAAAKPALIKINEAQENSTIDIDGALRKFFAKEMDGSELRSDDIGHMRVGQMDADIEITEGGLDSLTLCDGDLQGEMNISGHLGKVKIINGDLMGTLKVKNAIGTVNVLHGDITGNLKSGNSIKTIKAQNINQAEIIAQQGIDHIQVKNDMIDSMVSVGYDPTSMKNINAQAAGIDAYIGKINVKGVFSASTVAVGVAPDVQGNFMNGSGSTGKGEIGKVNLGQVDSQNETQPFGLIAKDAIAKIRVNRHLFNDNQLDDFYVTVLAK